MTPPRKFERVALTIRIPDFIKAELDRYCEARAQSANSVVVAAILTHLEQRARFELQAGFSDNASWSVLSRPDEAPVTPAPTPKASLRKDPRASLFAKQPAGGPRAKCPCGSGQQWRHCHGK